MPVVPAKTVRARARAIAHRYGAVCALSPTEQAVLGIRYDEEDDAVAETFLVRLGPGAATAVDQMLGVARGIAASASGALFVLDEKGIVHVGGRRHKLAAPRAIVAFGDSVVLAGDDRLWRFSDDGGQVREGPAVRARKLAASKKGIVAAADDGQLLFLDEGGVRDVPLEVGGHMAALAVDDEGRIAAASGRTVLGGDVNGVAPLATAPFDVHCVAVHQGRTLLSSRAHGMFFVEETSSGGRIQPLKPSLRAHTLVVKDGQLVASSDLFVATYDGEDFVTRDLAPFVRLADQRLPRFLQTGDPASV